MRLRQLIATSAIFIAVQPGLGAAQPTAPSSPSPTSVVILELFTSEGCSSCPPADKLLRQVHLKETGAGQLIVGISEHVTYWNNLGWKDPYSAQVFTDRQSVYASRLSPEGSYTPQMIVNGRDQFVGGNGGALESALQSDARRPHVDLRIVSSAFRKMASTLHSGSQGKLRSRSTSLPLLPMTRIDRMSCAERTRDDSLSMCRSLAPSSKSRPYRET
jgi:hypothetical protein